MYSFIDNFFLTSRKASYYTFVNIVNFTRIFVMICRKLTLSFLSQTFTGNKDRNTEKKNSIYEGLLTRWLRFVGKTRHDMFCMRTEVFGVKQKPGKGSKK